MRTLLSLFIILTLSMSAFAAGNTAGSAGAQFLKIGVGSRYQGMAGSGVATATDAYAAFWNPAGLVGVENWSLVFTNVNWLLDIDLNYFSAARQFDDVGVFAVSATVLSAGEQEITTTDASGQNGTGQTYSASSWAIGLSFARQLTHRFAFGATAKFVGETIGDVDSRGIGLDFGTLLHTGFNSLRFGISISNMGPELKFTGSALKVKYDDRNGNGNNTPVTAELSTRPYNLPLAFRIGVAYDMELGSNSLVTLTAEILDPNDGRQKGSLGVEFGFTEKFFLRGGYKLNYDEEKLALGGGMVAPLGDDSRLIIDYAWQDFGRLESTQRFSIGFTF